MLLRRNRTPVTRLRGECIATIRQEHQGGGSGGNRTHPKCQFKRLVPSPEWRPIRGWCAAPDSNREHSAFETDDSTNWPSRAYSPKVGCAVDSLHDLHALPDRHPYGRAFILTLSGAGSCSVARAPLHLTEPCFRSMARLIHPVGDPGRIRTYSLRFRKPACIPCYTSGPRSWRPMQELNLPSRA